MFWQSRGQLERRTAGSIGVTRPCTNQPSASPLLQGLRLTSSTSQPASGAQARPNPTAHGGASASFSPVERGDMWAARPHDSLQSLYSLEQLNGLLPHARPSRDVRSAGAGREPHHRRRDLRLGKRGNNSVDCGGRGRRRRSEFELRRKEKKGRERETGGMNERSEKRKGEKKREEDLRERRRKGKRGEKKG